ncbi:MAG: carboxymuconolactone decarboxylase family protein [Candidatus Omnitrophota bacterium]
MAIQPLSYENAGPAKDVFDKIKGKIGKVPHIYAAMGHSPAALKALLSFKENLSQGSLSGKEAEAIALIIGQINDCGYCQAAHTVMAKGAGWSEEETVALRRGQGPDDKIQALIDLAREIVEKDGRPGPQTVQRFLEAGYDQAALTEVIAYVSLNIFTNYFNHIADTEMDFPEPPAV